MKIEEENEHDEDHQDDATDQPGADKSDGGETDEQIEARARKQGWRPESEWDDARAEREGRRKPSRFMSAREYLDRIKDETPILRERNRRLEGQVEKFGKEIGELKKQTSELSELLRTQHNMSIEAKKKAYEKGIAAGKAEMRAAVKDGDEAKFAEAEKEVEQLEAEKKELEKVAAKAKESEEDDDGDGKGKRREREAPEADVDEETKDWIAANKKWFMGDAVLNAYAIDQNAAVRRDHPDWSVTDQLNEVKARTMEKFPEKFGKNPNRNGNGAVTQPSGGDRGDKNAKKFDALPPEAKKAYEGFKKQFEAKGVKYTQAEYLADYHEA